MAAKDKDLDTAIKLGKEIKSLVGALGRAQARLEKALKMTDEKKRWATIYTANDSTGSLARQIAGESVKLDKLAVKNT